MEKALFKFNNGKTALLCSNCYLIIKTGKDFTKKERQALIGQYNLEAQYCNKCYMNKVRVIAKWFFIVIFILILIVFTFGLKV